MSVSKRGRIYHYEFQLDGKRHRGTTGQTTKKAAEEYERRERDRISLAGGQATLSAAAVSWWTLHAQHLKSSEVIAADLETCRRLVNFDLDVRNVTTLMLKAAVAQRREEITQYGRRPSNATVNREIPYVIRPILNHAARVLDVRGMPSIDWRSVVLRKPKPKVRELTEQAREDIKEALLPHYRDLLHVYLRYGLRKDEAFFPPKNIDIEGRRIFIRERKGGDWHTLPIMGEDLAMFAARKSRAEAAGLRSIWFRETKDGICAIQPRAFQSYMRTVKKRLGIEMRVVHDLRHDAAMQAMRRTGGKLSSVQRLLGHENIQTTAIYAHATEEDILEALGESQKGTPRTIPTKAGQRAENE